MRSAIQIFEHQRLRVEDRLPSIGGGTVVFTQAHFEALTRYAERHRAPPFEIRHRAVVFKQYVGVIQIGALTLEILPKADREAHQLSSAGEPRLWRDVLFRMLKLCPQFGLRELLRADLRTEPADLLELYLVRFLSEVTRLVHEGLARSYRTVEENRNTFCGRLLVAENIRRNVAHAERVYVATHELSADRIENRILYHALQTLSRMSLRRSLRECAQRLLLEFPPIRAQAASLDDFARIVPSRHTDRYTEALALARMILLHYSPAPRAGGEDTLALLIDMNRLFQSFVLAVLRRTAPPGCSVDGTARADFWPEGEADPKRLLPDIVVSRDGKPALVLDTKWKMAGGLRPSDADLRQIFVYGEYFRAPRAALLYPARSQPAPARKGRFLKRDLRGELHYLNLFPDGAASGLLDARKVGEGLWQQLCPNLASGT